MAGRHAIAVGATVLLAVAACGGGDDDDGSSNPGAIETPTFAEEEDGGADGTAAQRPDDSTSTSAGDAGPAANVTTTVQAEKVSFQDPIGDATTGVGVNEPPPWTDLAGGSLERQGNAYRLIIRLGGTAPKTSSGSETMNVASFYDVDGDGAVDYEIWVNLGRSGWAPVWYDDEDHAAPGEASNVTVVVEGDELRLLFPDVMLGEPDRLRFSIASEYGPLSTIGTSGARRDDAPDDDESVSFP